MGTPVADGLVTLFFGGREHPIGINVANEEQRLTLAQATELFVALEVRIRQHRPQGALCMDATCGRVCAAGELYCRKHGGPTDACGMCGARDCGGHGGDA